MQYAQHQPYGQTPYAQDQYQPPAPRHPPFDTFDKASEIAQATADYARTLPPDNTYAGTLPPDETFALQSKIQRLQGELKTLQQKRSQTSQYVSQMTKYRNICLNKIPMVRSQLSMISNTMKDLGAAISNLEHHLRTDMVPRIPK